MDSRGGHDDGGTIDILEEVRKLEEIIPFEITPGTADDIERGDYEGNLMKYIQPWLDAAGADLEKGAKGTVVVPAGRYVLRPVDEPGLQIPHLRLPPNFHLLMEGVFVFYHEADVPILVVGEDDKANHCVELRLAVERDPLFKSDWSSEDNIGIKLINCYSCDINIIRSNFNTIGVQCIGVGVVREADPEPEVVEHGFAYNTVRLGNVQDNKYAVDCASAAIVETGTEAHYGWCSQNTFTGGRIWTAFMKAEAQSRYGLRIRPQPLPQQYTGEPKPLDNNRFINTSIELNDPPGGYEALPVLIDGGSLNHIIGARDEFNTGVFARLEGKSYENEFTTGYGTCVIDDQSVPVQNESAPSTAMVSGRGLLREFAKGTWNSGSLPEKWTEYKRMDEPEPAQFMFPGFFLASSADGQRYFHLDGFQLHWEAAMYYYVGFDDSRAIGVCLATRARKRFVVRRAVHQGNPGRVAIRCYDADGDPLGGSVDPYCTGLKAYWLYWQATRFGGCYEIGSNTHQDVFFRVRDEVDHVDVLITGGYGGEDPDIAISSFSIECVDGGSPEVLIPAGLPGDPGLRLALEPPSRCYLKGTRVYNADPQPGETQGWVCTTPGGVEPVWTPMPNLPAE